MHAITFELTLNLHDHSTATSQTDGSTDDMPRNTALCESV